MNILLAYNDTERLEPRSRACRAARKLYEAQLVVTSITPVAVGAAARA